MTYIWAHRGASAYAPENTLEAFSLAIQMKAEGIELDVQLTKDHHIVVCHDETIDRTSDHSGFIKDYTLAELKSFNFNNQSENYPFCSIPTLEEVLKLLKPTDLILNIELKTGIFDYEGIEKQTVELVNAYQMNEKVIYSSFNHYSCLRVKELQKDAYCAFLHADKFIEIADYASKYGMKALHPAYYFLLDKKYMQEAATNNLLINSWTINNQEDINFALALNINAIITNYPDRALNLREKYLNK